MIGITVKTFGGDMLVFCLYVRHEGSIFLFHYSARNQSALFPPILIRSFNSHDTNHVTVLFQLVGRSLSLVLPSSSLLVKCFVMFFLSVSSYRLMFYGSADCYGEWWHTCPGIVFHYYFSSLPLLSQPTSLWKDIFLSTSHHFVMIKTGGLWQPVRGNCTQWMIAGLQKRAIVSTLCFLLVLRGMKASVLAPACYVIDWWVCCVWVEGLHRKRRRERSFWCTVQPEYVILSPSVLEIQSSFKFIEMFFAHTSDWHKALRSCCWCSFLVASLSRAFLFF